MPSFFHALKSRMIERMTSSHLAGPSVADAVRIYDQALRNGWSCTFGYWSGPDDTPATNGRMYSTALQAILEKSLNCYLSIKVTALKYDIGIVRELLELAKGRDVRIHFDAMDPESADPTFELLERALRTHRNLGCTLPSRWRRSIEDTARVIDYGIPVRIVKGQWADPHAPGQDAHRNYREIVRRLSGRAAQVAVATHDHGVAREALHQLRKTETPCEMEQLSSLPQNCARLAQSLGVPLRIYVPFGFASLPYDIWQVRTRPQIVGWVLRDALVGKHRPLAAVRTTHALGTPGMENASP